MIDVGRIALLGVSTPKKRRKERAAYINCVIPTIKNKRHWNELLSLIEKLWPCTFDDGVTVHHRTPLEIAVLAYDSEGGHIIKDRECWVRISFDGAKETIVKDYSLSAKKFGVR